MMMELLAGFAPLALIVFLIWLLTKWINHSRRARAPGGQQASPTHHWPALHEYECEVVGESQHQRELKFMAGSHGDAAASVTTTAILIPDKNNIHDPYAVRVEINGSQVGYLSREDARRYRRLLAELKIGLVNASCGALITGGFLMKDGTKASYGVKLDIPPLS